LGTVAASVIGNIIAEAKNIASLDVSDNDFGDEGIATLTGISPKVFNEDNEDCNPDFFFLRGFAIKHFFENSEDR